MKRNLSEANERLAHCTASQATRSHSSVSSASFYSRINVEFLLHFYSAFVKAVETNIWSSLFFINALLLWTKLGKPLTFFLKVDFHNFTLVALICLIIAYADFISSKTLRLLLIPHGDRTLSFLPLLITHSPRSCSLCI